MTFAADGRKIRHTFHRIMMRSAAKLAYPQAQAAIDGKPDDKTGPILDTVLKPLWDAYAVLKRGRDARQPLELDLPERKILLKPDGTVDRVIVPERLDAHKLIEEFMIQANVAAAETLEAQEAGAGLPRPRRAVAGQAGIAARVPADARHVAGARRADAARPVQRHPGAGARRRQRGPGQRGGAALAEPGRSIRPTISAISASTCGATRISPRRSAAMPT